MSVLFEYQIPAVSEAAARSVLGAPAPVLLLCTWGLYPAGPQLIAMAKCTEAQKVAIVVCTGGAAYSSSACSCLSLECPQSWVGIPHVLVWG